jgi:predicted O-linked N-acetylglucosamine transferase (SPINDLY family)
MSKARKSGDPAAAVEKITEMLLHGKVREALKAARGAAQRFPANANVLTRFGDALYMSGDLREAEKKYRRAIERDSGIFQAHYGLGSILRASGAYSDAAQSFERALAVEPEDADARIALAGYRFSVGDVDAAIGEYERILEQRGVDFETLAKARLEIAKIIPGSPTRGNAEILKARAEWAAVAEKSLRAGQKKSLKGAKSPGKSASARPKPVSAKLAPKKAKSPAQSRASKKLRIAYISAFFGSRNWMKPVFGVINEHDRDAFEIHLLRDDETPTAASGYRAHRDDEIHDITALNDDRAAQLIQKLDIDVLIDLNGYSYTRRLGLMLRKPAPVQLGWFNMYATTGMRSYDAIVGDAEVVENEEAAFYSEAILRVPGTYLAFNVQYETPDVVPPPCLSAPGRALTFGCLAPQYKISPPVLAAWAEILKASPGTRLILRNTFLSDAGNRGEIHARFAKLGIEPERVALHPPVEHFEFLKTYAEIDVALDTFPYSGGTTTMEALWQGVPVLTFDGDRWASRTSKSLLRAARFEDWVMPSRETYIKRAIDLAHSERTPAMLAGRRDAVRWGLLSSAVCDTARLCGELEAIFKKMARRAATDQR